MSDLKGQKIRMMGNPLFVDTMNAMGGNGISMGINEVFGALQTGVIDGAENNPPTLFTSNQYSAGIKYYTLTNHLIIPEIFVMSKVTWDKMAPADQALVKKFAREAQMEQRAMWDKSVAEYTAKLKAAGIEFIAIDNKPFFDATAPVRAKYGANLHRPDEAHRRHEVARGRAAAVRSRLAAPAGAPKTALNALAAAELRGLAWRPGHEREATLRAGDGVALRRLHRPLGHRAGGHHADHSARGVHALRDEQRAVLAGAGGDRR